MDTTNHRKYFVMPVIFGSLVHKQRLSEHVACRVSFIVPFIIITAIAMGILFNGEDTPTGKWSDRRKIIEPIGTDAPTSSNNSVKGEKLGNFDKVNVDAKANTKTDVVDTIAGEIIVVPTFKEATGVVFSLQTLARAAPYACSFGGELAINSIIGSYYLKNFPKLGQTGSGR
jgi:NNP family nitrate/nitrite transporter-like MFS transporter